MMIMTTKSKPHSPDLNCALCPRLVRYREDNRVSNPDWHNAPALSFGDKNARTLVVGLAPGRTGANRTGRVFTGDPAGHLLFATLINTGFASGHYSHDGHDTITLKDIMITNCVMCAPPKNAPTTDEQNACRPFLASLIRSMPRLKIIVTLGDTARKNTLKALGFAPSQMSSGHGVMAKIDEITLINSYHCSRLNMNTGRLTPKMFEDIFKQAQFELTQA